MKELIELGQHDKNDLNRQISELKELVTIMTTALTNKLELINIETPPPCGHTINNDDNNMETDTNLFPVVKCKSKERILTEAEHNIFSGNKQTSNIETTLGQETNWQDIDQNTIDQIDQIQTHSTAVLDEKIKLRLAFKQSQEQEENKSELMKISDKVDKLMTRQTTSPGTNYDQSVILLQTEMTSLSTKFDSITSNRN